jgi:hypothetical protein
MLHPELNLSVNRGGVVSRRLVLQGLAGATAGGVVSLGWRDYLMARADELKRQGRSMILLWMDGGPSQFDTFNPKIGSKNQGPAGAIDTNVPGVQFADMWPKTARVMDKIALIRSMNTPEAEHDRAIAHLRTGYRLNPAIQYPTFGSIVSWARRASPTELPPFIRIGKPRIFTRDVNAGVLGSSFASFNLEQAGSLPPNVVPQVDPDVVKRRLALAARLDAEFARQGGSVEVEAKQGAYDRAARFVLSPRMKVFDLERESPALRDSYGRTNFGQGCLLARRLVEQGVGFVEVLSTGDKNDAGWDTHGNGYRDQPNLCAEVDPAYSTLLRDLEDRGLLETTVVVWMGEFGRTPRIKADGGRDHYAKGWLVGFSGGGVRAGQVIGATDKDGVEVTDRPIAAEDLFATYCHLLGIDPSDEYHTLDERPIKLVNNGELIPELV